jgi:NADH-quinone oxidoreductase subunit C
MELNNTETSSLNELISAALKSRYADKFIGEEQQYDFAVYTIDKSVLIDALSFLKTDPEIACNFLTTLCGIHMPDQEGAEFGMMYQLQNMQKNVRIRVKVWMSKDDLHVPTATGLWPTANWMERQEYDFFGFKFDGHPELKRILNMDEMNYFQCEKNIL